MNRPDWTQIRLEYVHGTMTLGALAREHGLQVKTVEKRCERENWSDLRRAASEAVGLAAERTIVEERSAELAKWNAGDIIVGKSMRQAGIAILNEASQPNASRLTPAELRALSAVFESAQRIVRTAFGVSTQNFGIAGQNGEGPIGVTTATPEEYEAILGRVLASI